MTSGLLTNGKRILEWKPRRRRWTRTPRIRWLDDERNDTVMNTNNWKELGMTWLRKLKPTKGCKLLGEGEDHKLFQMRNLLSIKVVSVLFNTVSCKQSTSQLRTLATNSLNF